MLRSGRIPLASGACRRQFNHGLRDCTGDSGLSGTPRLPDARRHRIEAPGSPPRAWRRTPRASACAQCPCSMCFLAFIPSHCGRCLLLACDVTFYLAARRVLPPVVSPSHDVPGRATPVHLQPGTRHADNDRGSRLQVLHSGRRWQSKYNRRAELGLYKYGEEELRHST